MLPPTLSSAKRTFAIDPLAASNDYIGQTPLEIFGRRETIDSLSISSRYARFGNNFIQIANAAVIAEQLGLDRLSIPWISNLLSPLPRRCGSIIVSLNSSHNVHGCLKGSFYAPFGLENLFADVDVKKIAPLIRLLGRTLFGNLFAKTDEEKNPIVAAHFRGGDVFDRSIPAHHAYGQPPAAYYIKSLCHAIENGYAQKIVLVCEDDTNPALPIVKSHFESKIEVEISSNSFLEDMKILLSADVIIASSSTFCEFAALTSKKLKSLYFFRGPSFQLDFAPFVQSMIGDLCVSSGLCVNICDDLSLTFTSQKGWQNSEAQRTLITTFDINRLRLFPYS